MQQFIVLYQVWYITVRFVRNKTKTIYIFHVSFIKYAEWFMCSINSEFEQLLSCNISGTTKRTNNGQVPTCSQEPVDSRLQLAWRQHSKKWEILPADYWLNRISPCSAAPLRCSKQLPLKNILQIGGGRGASWGILSILKSLQQKPQTMMSENRYTSPKIDIFRQSFYRFYCIMNVWMNEKYMCSLMF